MTENEIEALPPRIPETLVALDRARALLGECASKGLNPKAAAELQALVGDVPDAYTATAWKQGLKFIREDMLEKRGR